MVRVEAPPLTLTPPPARDRLAPWLLVVALLLLADAVVPWERYCAVAGGGFRERCFSPSLWSGSASFLGVVALILLIAYVIGTFRAGIAARVGLGRFSAFVGAIAALAAKTVIVAGNDAIRSRNQSDGGPAWIGVWIGILLTLAGLSLLATAVWRTRRLRSIVVSAAVVFAVVAITIPYARSGLAWWGGPLAEPGFLGGGNGVGYVRPPDRPILFDGLLYVRNLGEVTATLDGLDLVDPSGRIHIRGTYVIRRGRCAADAITLPVRSLNGCVHALDGYRIHPGGEADSVILAILLDVPRPGVYRSGWFRIRYHVGLLRFEVFRTDQLVICAPEPGKKHCPGNGFF